MRAKTYARLSLLIPFLVWGILLLYWVVAGSIPSGASDPGVSTAAGDWIGRAVAFYVIGILFWILPYLLLGLILFFLTFLWEPRIMARVFVFSPFAMTVLTLAVTTLISFQAPWTGAASYSLQDLASFNILVTVFILIWGYLCVGLGFGGYKLFQRLRIITDEVRPVPSNVYE